jgi:predicted DNA-binding transcriptional regulator AlpA
MIQIVEEYNDYVLRIPELISKSYYKADYFINNLGLKNATYYRKLKDKNFTPQEIKKITELLFPEELLIQKLKKSEEDIKAGRVTEHTEVMAKLRAKYSL